MSVPEACVVCGAQAGEDLVAAADAEGGQDWRFARCGACSCVYLRDAERHVAHDEALEGELFLTWYLESGAGLEAMIPPLVALPFPTGGSLLDVGCGYGFSAWWVQEYLGGRVLGLERAAYGAAGAAALGVEIMPEYVLPDTDVPGGPYDVVHASEVIEHVADPAAFLQGLHRATAADGRLVLTTPDASAIRPDRPAAEVVEALSPGLHRFLLSRDHLQRLVREAGFTEQHVVQNGAHLVLWAGSEKLGTPAWAAPDPHVLLDAYQRLERSGVSALARGASYRSFRLHVKEGELAAARDAWQRLCARTLDDLGLDLARFGGDDLVEYTSTSGAAARVGRWPTFLGPALYWAGMLETLADPSDIGSRCRLFADSITVMRHDVATDHRFAHESAALVEPARFHLLQVAAQTVAREAPALLGKVGDDLPVSTGDHVERTSEELDTLTTALRYTRGSRPWARLGRR